MANVNIFQAPQLVNVIDDDLDIFTPQVYNNSTSQVPKAPVPDAVFSDDPLALSITSYLIWKNNPGRRWVPVSEVGRPSYEARDMAAEIRKYYLHRSTMKVLMGQTPTEFQYKMNGFLADIRPLKIDEQGLLYRIPYFYQEDLALDRVFEGAEQIEQDGPLLYSTTNHTTLTPILEVLKSRKSGDFCQFWFSDTSGHRCVFEVKSDNKLLSIFRSLFKQPKLPVSGYAKMEALRGSHIRTRYWRLTNLELQ